MLSCAACGSGVDGKPNIPLDATAVRSLCSTYLNNTLDRRLSRMLPLRTIELGTQRNSVPPSAGWPRPGPFSSNVRLRQFTVIQFLCSRIESRLPGRQAIDMVRLTPLRLRLFFLYSHYCGSSYPIQCISSCSHRNCVFRFSDESRLISS